MRPVTAYAESKVRVEDGLHELADEDFSPVSLRNATAYGWSPRLRLDVVVNDLVARALLTREVRVLSDGSPWRPVVHAQDIASVVAEVLVAPPEGVPDQRGLTSTERDDGRGLVDLDRVERDGSVARHGRSEHGSLCQTDREQPARARSRVDGAVAGVSADAIERLPGSEISLRHRD